MRSRHPSGSSLLRQHRSGSHSWLCSQGQSSLPRPPLGTREGGYAPFLPEPPHLPWDLGGERGGLAVTALGGQDVALPWPAGRWGLSRWLCGRFTLIPGASHGACGAVPVPLDGRDRSEQAAPTRDQWPGLSVHTFPLGERAQASVSTVGRPTDGRRWPWKTGAGQVPKWRGMPCRATLNHARPC